MHVSALDVAMPIGEPIETIATIADAADASARTWTLAVAFDRVLLVENDCCRLVGEPRVFDNALAALASLDAAQRAALGLDEARFAAFASVDALRAALAAEDLPAARELVVRCLRELALVFGVAPSGEWKIRRPVLTTTQQLVRYADRALADFARSPAEALGRLRQLAMHLGVIARDDSPRRTAFASPSGPMLELPIEIVHPVHRGRTREIPFVPEDDRPDLVFEPIDRYADSTIVADPLTALYDRLRHLCQRIVHLSLSGAPVDSEADELQTLVDELAEVAQSPPTIIDAWERTATRREQVTLTYRGSNPATDGQPPPAAVLWLDADTIATVRGDHLVTLSLATKQPLREYLINDAVVQTCDDTGRYVLVGAEPEDYSGFGIGCLDLQAGAWLDVLPDHIPAVTCGYDEHEVTALYEHRRDARSTACHALCFARGGRAVLTSLRNDVLDGRGICSSSTLFSEVAFATLDAAAKRPAPILLADGSLVDPTREEAERIDREMQQRRIMTSHLAWPSAIARAERWRFLLPSLHAGDVERTYFRLGFAIDAACFSPDGRRLLVAGDELVVIDVPSGAITWRAAA